MNTYSTSTGERVSKAEIDRRVTKAKSEKIRQFIDDNGYVYCEDCKRNDCKPIDCSHDISVKECQDSGRTELAWDVNNITLRGRPCHQKYDGLDIKSNTCGNAIGKRVQWSINNEVRRGIVIKDSESPVLEIEVYDINGLQTSEMNTVEKEMLTFL